MLEWYNALTRLQMLQTGVKLLCAVRSHIDGNAYSEEMVTDLTQAEAKASASGLHINTLELHLILQRGTECLDSRSMMPQLQEYGCHQ
jgi:hypothetical protein